jgi:hypothetical protein
MITLNEKQQATIERLKSVKGFKEAYNRLVINKDISTGDIKFFNISIESFLRYAQRGKEKQQEMIAQLIEMFK